MTVKETRGEMGLTPTANFLNIIAMKADRMGPLGRKIGLGLTMAAVGLQGLNTAAEFLLHQITTKGAIGELGLDSVQAVGTLGSLYHMHILDKEAMDYIGLKHGFGKLANASKEYDETLNRLQELKRMGGGLPLFYR